MLDILISRRLLRLVIGVRHVIELRHILIQRHVSERERAAHKSGANERDVHKAWLAGSVNHYLASPMRLLSFLLIVIRIGMRRIAAVVRP